MATVYYDDTVTADGDLGNLLNWWTNSGATSPLGGLPVLGDYAYLQTDSSMGAVACDCEAFTSVSVNGDFAQRLILSGGATLAGGTVALTLGGNGVLIGGGTITGTVTLAASNVAGSAHFLGDCKFTGAGTSVFTSGTVEGVLTMDGASSTVWSIVGGTFNGDAQLTGNATNMAITGGSFAITSTLTTNITISGTAYFGGLATMSNNVTVNGALLRFGDINISGSTCVLQNGTSFGTITATAGVQITGWATGTINSTGVQYLGGSGVSADLISSGDYFAGVNTYSGTVAITGPTYMDSNQTFSGNGTVTNSTTLYSKYTAGSWIFRNSYCQPDCSGGGAIIRFIDCHLDDAQPYAGTLSLEGTVLVTAARFNAIPTFANVTNIDIRSTVVFNSGFAIAVVLPTVDVLTTSQLAVFNGNNSPVGNYHQPIVSNVQAGVTYGPSSSLTGTLSTGAAAGGYG